jgi:phenylacetate-CoA ligase
MLLTQQNKNNSLYQIVSHAALHSPYFKEQEWADKFARGRTLDFQQDIPVTSNVLLKEDAAAFFSANVSETHGAIHTKYTSGSTGRPSEIRKTSRHFEFNQKENRRLLSGWNLNGHKDALVLQAVDDLNSKGNLAKKRMPNGTNLWSLRSREIHSVLNCLLETSSTSFQCMAGTFYQVFALAREKNVRPNLRLAITIGEMSDPKIRDEIESIFNLRILDIYGTVESGIIAARCRSCGSYHPADRHLNLEVLKENGSPAQVGETGRVIVTPLFNYAMPLIRYDTGDLAQLCESNSCVKSDIAIHRILGRAREMFKLKNGDMLVPSMSAYKMLRLGVKYYKLVQTAFDEVELHYIPKETGILVNRRAVQNLVDLSLDPSLKVKPVIVSDLPSLPNGKYVEHECRI